MENQNIINGFDFSSLPVIITFVGKVADKEWPHYLWNVAVAYNGGLWSFPYKCGLGHVEKKPDTWPMPNPPYRKGTLAYEQWAATNMQPKKPKVSDVMYSVLMDSDADNMSFNDWCSNYDMDNDSMTAFKIYQACCDSAKELNKAFSKEQIQAMKTALEDY